MEEPTPKTAVPSGLSREGDVLLDRKHEPMQLRYEVPEGSIDCGDGFYIVTDLEPCGETRYLSCSPNCAIGRYSNDLWQAQLYIEHMKGNQPK